MNRDQRTLDIEPPLLTFDKEGAGVYVDLRRLIAGRMLISASSGGGKSWLLRYICEQYASVIPQLIVDYEGEFASLKSVHEYVWVGDPESGADVALNEATVRTVSRSLSRSGASVILDLGSFEMDERQELAAAYIGELLALRRSDWKPMLIVIDEAQELAPQEGNVASSKPVKRLVSNGRKRGWGVVVATQQISRLDKGAAEATNRLIGRTVLDVDLARSAKELGFKAGEQSMLQRLRPGQWYGFGSAIADGEGVLLARAGDVRSEHPDGTKAEIVVPTSEAIAKALIDLQALANEGSAAGAGEEELIEEIARLRAEIKAGLTPDPADIRRAALEATRPLQAKIEGLELSLERARQSARDILLDLGELPPEATTKENLVVAPEDRADIAPGVPTSPESEPEDGLVLLKEWIWDAKQLLMIEALGVSRTGLTNAELAKASEQSPTSSAYRDRRKALLDAGVIEYPRRGWVKLL